MRHQRKRHRIGRGHAHRKATLAALSSALIAHKRITTTAAKAKALRTFVEPLLNRAKEDSTHNRREVFRRLQDKQAVTELFGDVASKIGDRPGGYTRVVKLGQRAGDGAEMAIIELVDYNDVRPDGDAGRGRRRRTRRGSSGSGRRRSSSKSPTETPAAATVASVETADQTTGGHDVDKVKTEEPVAESQTTPVPERTEPQAEAKKIAAEAADTAEEPEAVEAPAEEEATTDDTPSDTDATAEAVESAEADPAEVEEETARDASDEAQKTGDSAEGTEEETPDTDDEDAEAKK